MSKARVCAWVLAVGLSAPARADEVSGPEPAWPAVELQLGGSATACLARDPMARVCALTVGSYNLHALSLDVPRRLSLAAARAVVLDKALNTIFFAAEAR